MKISIKVPAWGIQEVTGYEPQTTFWQDFSIAEHFGMAAIKDTFRRCFKEWKHDTVYATELALVLNWKSWAWYDLNREEMSRLYSDLFYEVQDYVYEHWDSEATDYYYRITD